MQNIQISIQNLSDSEVLKVTQEVFNIVYTQIPYEEVLQNSEGLTEVDMPLLLSPENLECELTTAESAETCRFVLEMYAKNPELEPFVQQALEKVQGSKTLFVEEVVFLGLLINLTLLNATTTVKATKDAEGNITWEVTKKEASPELLNRLFNPIVELANKFGVGSTFSGRCSHS